MWHVEEADCGRITASRCAQTKQECHIYRNNDSETETRTCYSYHCLIGRGGIKSGHGDLRSVLDNAFPSRSSTGH